ncbi:MAG: 3-5 exoribonuclease [Thermoleophilaceae bacterium]|jgi:3'-5' exoribonuclease|nr:3-5 exoribonuclease [Thermoleophilaceae bacterium]
MEQTTLTHTRCFVRDLANGQEVNDVFVVRTHSRRQKRNGEEFLKLQLGDMTGAVEAVVWDGVEEIAGVCPTGAVVRILGRYSVDERYGAAITIRKLRAAADHEYDLNDLTEAPPVPYEQMAADLDQLIETIRRPHFRTLLARLLDRSTPTGAAYHLAPAAKHYHQAYQHGLLEHCLSVAQGVNALASGPFAGGVDRELAVTGALLHDIGKTEVYASVNGAIELTDRGKLLGEIPLGYYMIRRELERIDGFPQADAEGLLHIILSHHGKLEHGSPVVPCTREATLVHFVDNLGGNLGSFDRIERSLADGASWSDFDRGLSTSAFFATREQVRQEEAA